MDRIYESVVYDNLKKYSQMAFLVGPRQVGKTTIAKKLQSRFRESLYLNYDSAKDRRLILSGQSFVEDIFPTNVLREESPLIIFDEIHKYGDWKNYVKGFYDLYRDHYKIIITGSARLDVYQSGGDSLMGRYFQYDIHPLSVAELSSSSSEDFPRPPCELSAAAFENLYKYGGFPDPYGAADDRYYNLWQSTRFKQLIHEDIIAAKALLKDQNITVENVAKLLSVATSTLYRHIPGGRGSIAEEM